ncbi:MAG: hypothetical protein NTW03_17105 [Verrucomicrobia bacterium]|nr:hypothetical protein [Verrucomicrobiota bacterium]
MEIKKAVVTVAGTAQRTLPLQTLVDRDGTAKTALCIIIEEILQAGIEEICLVIHPNDRAPYTAASPTTAPRTPPPPGDMPAVFNSSNNRCRWVMARRCIAPRNSPELNPFSCWWGTISM